MWFFTFFRNQQFLCSNNSKYRYRTQDLCNHFNQRFIWTKQAVIYSRVSSLGERQSNERQIEDLKILDKQKYHTIVKIYEEKISRAKKNAERAILTECLEYCISQNVKILLLSELSRLGRDVDEVLKNVMLCKENKLNVYFQKDNLSIFDDSGKEHPFLTIFIAVLGTVARWNERTLNSA